MNDTPQQLKDYWTLHPAKKCEMDWEDTCSGRLTKEHCWIYAGKQIQEVWAVIDLCEYHHLGNGLLKDYNQYISINRMTKEDEKKYPRKNWKQIRKYLNSKYEETNPIKKM